MPTVGVAIAVPEPHGEHLRTARLGFGDSLAESIPSHITLIGPTQVAAEDMAKMSAELAEVAHQIPGFTVRLRGTDTFRPTTAVVFVAVSEGAKATEHLVRAIRSALGDRIADSQFPFHPHVTIAQDIAAADLDRAQRDLSDFECFFEVASFSLYAHEESAGWRRLHDYQLSTLT